MLISLQKLSCIALNQPRVHCVQTMFAVEPRFAMLLLNIPKMCKHDFMHTKT